MGEGFSILYETGVRGESILRLFFCGWIYFQDHFNKFGVLYEILFLGAKVQLQILHCCFGVYFMNHWQEDNQCEL